MSAVVEQQIVQTITYMVVDYLNVRDNNIMYIIIIPIIGHGDSE